MSDITFPDAVTLPTGKRAINCASKPMDGVKVKIGPLSGVQIGAEFVITWLGFSEPNVPLPDTKSEFTLLVTEREVSEGLEWIVRDYKNHIKPIRDGSARVGYTINGGPSTSVVLVVRLLNANGETCDEAGSSLG